METVTSNPLETKESTPGELRATRQIVPFVSDYLTDIKGLSPEERINHYRMLKEGLGVHTVRVEFKMGTMFNPDGSVNQETSQRYEDSLRAIKDAGLTEPVVYLHSPSAWMEREATDNPDRYRQLFQSYAEEVKRICSESGVFPQYLQVMSEINNRLQTHFSSDQVAEMIKATAVIFADHPETKIMTTIFAGRIAGKWRRATKEIVKKAGPALQAVGFDYYPGSYENTVNLPLIGKPPYEAFASKTPYRWVALQKINSKGILHGKDVLIAEIGVPSLWRFFSRRAQHFGYDRIMQSLDHFLLPYEQQGYKGNKGIFQGIGFFSAAELDPEAIGSRAPGGIDATPWTLYRKGKGKGEWKITPAGERLKPLIESRVYPSKK